jgi:hypothetical protein
MEDAKRIAVACYRQVIEDGRDVCNSESDAESSDHSEVLEGMYTEGATLASSRLTTAQSAQEPDQRLPTPVPSDDDDDLTEDQVRTLRGFKKGKGRAGGLVTSLAPG